MNVTSNPSRLHLYDSSGNPISSLGGAINVHDADVHTTSIVHYVYQNSGAPYSLSVDAAQLATSITVTSAAGLSVGDYLHITDTSNNNHEHSVPKITGIAGNVLTLSNPIDHVLLSATTEVQKVIRNMNLSGTVGSPQIFKLQPSTGETWHITHFGISMTDNAAMDDSTFGGIAALTNGVVVRIVNATTGEYFTLFRWSTNSSFQRDGADHEYNPKAPAGSYGFSAHIDIHNKYGSIVKIANTATANSYIEFLVQDDLTALTSFEIKCHGHIEGI